MPIAYRQNKSNGKAKVKVEETDPTWSQILFFPVKIYRPIYIFSTYITSWGVNAIINKVVYKALFPISFCSENNFLSTEQFN